MNEEKLKDSANSKGKVFMNPDGTPSITAGAKCAFNNMIFAGRWTPAAKMIASMYFDMSEKYGHAFAKQDYYVFRTKVSKRTFSRANEVIMKSKLFTLTYFSDNNLEVKPNLSEIEDAYSSYLVDHDLFMKERAERRGRDKMSAAGAKKSKRADKTSGDSCQKVVDAGQNGAHNLSNNRSPDALPSFLLEETFPTQPEGSVKPSLVRSENGCSHDQVGDDELKRSIAKMHEILPDHEPYDGENRKPFDARRSSQGELPQLRKLVRAGWTMEEIEGMVEAYLTHARERESTAGTSYRQAYKTLSSIFSELLSKTCDKQAQEGDDEFYGQRVPARIFPTLRERSCDKMILRQPDRGNTHADDCGIEVLF